MSLVHLRAAGCSLVLDTEGPSLPRVVHWGADLGELSDTRLQELLEALAPAVPNNSLDAPWPLTLLPAEVDGWVGSPGLSGHRAGAGTFARLELGDLEIGANAVTCLARDGLGLSVRLQVRLDPYGVVHWSASLTNDGAQTYDLAALRALLPLPPAAAEVLDLTGRWIRERSPQRSALQHGTHLRASRRGRTGADATLLLVAGTPGFGFGSGEVWGTHVAWSGDHETLVERLPEGAGLGHASVLGGGELLAPGEVRLEPEQRYDAPEVLFAWSDEGLDGLSDRFHRYVRARPSHPRTPRPVVLNTWEAVYFDHDLDRLTALADTAASIGVERFVLDDGWFRHRRDDKAGLGDWYVDTDLWPAGLAPIVTHVHGLGLQMGLWFEPEMVNPDSDLARAHPDWVLNPTAPLSRNQHVLDVANPAAYAYLLERISALVQEHSLDYLKWDHNRDIHAATHDGRPGIHAQTLAVYALLDELRARHPGLEIESCSSGGARADLGILARTDRVWASDCNDAVERQQIQRWTALLLPPELIGAHVGPYVAHSTGRAVDLSMRCATALFGHAGIEWDITTCPPQELDTLRAWTSLYKEVRPLLHSGRVVRADLADPGALLYGVVAADRSQALLAYVRLSTAPDAMPGRVRLPGLDPTRTYRVAVRDEIGGHFAAQRSAAPWLTAAPVELPGSVLASVGLPMPALGPAQALLLHLTAT